MAAAAVAAAAVAATAVAAAAGRATDRGDGWLILRRPMRGRDSERKEVVKGAVRLPVGEAQAANGRAPWGGALCMRNCKAVF